MTPTHPRSPTPTQLPDLRRLGPMSDGQRSTFVGLSRDNHAFMRETRTVQVMRCVPLSFASPLSLSQDMDARRSYLEGDRKEVNESLASVHGFASSCSKGSRHLQTGCWRMTKCSRRGRPWLSLRLEIASHSTRRNVTWHCATLLNNGSGVLRREAERQGSATSLTKRGPDGPRAKRRNSLLAI